MGNRIREWREKRSLTLEELAETSGFSPSYLSRMESDRRNVSLRNLMRIAQALGITERELVTEDGGYYIDIDGLVGAGGEINTEVHQAYGGDVAQIKLDIPLPTGLNAYEVWGNSMLPKYDPGDVVLIQRAADPLGLVLGDVALVVTREGGRFLKRVLRGSAPGLYDLESFNAPTMKDKEIVEAGRIYLVVPSSQVRREVPEKEIARRVKKGKAA